MHRPIGTSVVGQGNTRRARASRPPLPVRLGRPWKTNPASMTASKISPGAATISPHDTGRIRAPPTSAAIPSTSARPATTAPPTHAGVPSSAVAHVTTGHSPGTTCVSARG